MAKTEKPTYEWLTLKDAAARTGKSDGTIRAALRKHSAFVRDETWVESKPVQRDPNGNERPGGGKGTIWVRADALDSWAAQAPERKIGVRSTGTVYRINVKDRAIEPGDAEGVMESASKLTPNMTIQQAIAVLLAPFDVQMRRANGPRKSKDTSESSVTEDRQQDPATGDAMHDLIDNSDPDRFELELIEA